MESVARNIIPRVSIVLNTRNRSRLLHRSIESALNQTLKSIELIVVDGASTDLTKDVVEQYKLNDSRVKYLYIQENRSAAYCINKGFNAAKGEFIAILDDDDEFLPTKLEKQVALMDAVGEKLGIVYCWEEFWDDKTEKSLRFGKEKARGNLYHQLLNGPCTGGGTLMLVRKTAIEKAGGYDETIRFGADYQFNLNIARYFNHDFVPEVLVRTHWNHEYVHLTTQRGGNVNYEAVIEYYEKILSDHSEGYDLLSDARLWQYKSIISAATHLHNYRLALSYFKLGITSEASVSKKSVFAYSTIRRCLISLFSEK